jgi:hypothetical protein
MSEAKKQSEEAIEIDESGKIAKKPTREEKKAAKSIDVKNESRWKRFAIWYKTKKKKSVPLTILVLLLVLAAIPWSRYMLAGVFWKNNYSVEIVDSTAGTPVSGAEVSLGSVHAISDGKGKAVLRNAKVGKHSLFVTKKYYKDYSSKVLVPIMAQKEAQNIKLVATGRQVKVSVKNIINHKALADVNITVSDISAKTDSAGSATIVLPVGAESEKAKLSLDGYNDSNVTVVADDKTIKENDFTLTPAGKIYLLSKLSGKIDVVKTNLDGSGRQTVLAGTGNEEDNNTILLASRDWKYLALKSKRDNKQPRLYMIDTSNDELTTMDDSSADFNPVGWYDQHFVYTADKKDVQYYQPKNVALKSYNAPTKQTTLIDETSAENALLGTIYESFGTVYVVDDHLVYAKTWQAQYYPSYVSGKQMSINSIKTDGTGKKALAHFDEPPGSTGYIASTLYKPNSIYYRVTTEGNNYDYKYENSTVKPISKLNDDTFYKSYPTYLVSPSDKETFWSEQRDGKSSLFLGDEDGGGAKQIAALSDFQTYGWYTDDYLLISKNSSELYIMSRDGLDEKNQPVKITDYHKPQQNFFGYGGGYGGI